jgi:hypothetical protein
MRTTAILLAWACVITTGVGFVIPWARIDLREPSLIKQVRGSLPASETLSGLTKDLGRITAKIKRGAQTITGELPTLADIPKEVSGIQIPQMANQKNAQTALALMELLTGKQEYLGLKSYAVYLLPGIALLCGLLLTVVNRQRLVPWGVAGLCAVIASVGFWKLLTTNLQSLMVAITIGPGLWLSLWAYVGLAAAAVLSGVLMPKQT